MENRQPYKLTNVTRLYNIYQIVGCSFFVAKAFKIGFSFNETWKCFDDPKYIGHMDEFTIVQGYFSWWFLFLRLSEFLETIFFILKKKFNQVTILHVYHHISVPFIVWIFFIHSGGRMIAYIAILNSFVHVFMYGYYFLSSFQMLQKFTNFIKPCITAIQIIQLFVLFIHSVVALLPGCHASRLFYLQAINLGLLITLFLKFFIKTYLKSKVSSFVACSSKNQ